ncbi:hypothetical protein GGR50DRAFT_111012 [Xylaria sp. CBS 124048]|nr:hypothetical protein GGR50DRAFT_111012 [Xylaria sp. CBS 124048]
MPFIDIIRSAKALTGSEPGTPETTQATIQIWTLIANYPYRSQIKCILSSPLRRAVETAVYAFVFPEMCSAPATLLAELQETSLHPIDRGLSREALKDWLGFAVDVTRLRDDWELKGPGTPMYPVWENVSRRAQVMRIRLRITAQHLNDDDRIVVITHGLFAHFLVDDFTGIAPDRPAGFWRRGRYRTFKFEDPSSQDMQARLVETPESFEAHAGYPRLQPLSAEEDARLRDVANSLLQTQVQAGSGLLPLPSFINPPPVAAPPDVAAPSIVSAPSIGAAPPANPPVSPQGQGRGQAPLRRRHTPPAQGPSGSRRRRGVTPSRPARRR